MNKAASKSPAPDQAMRDKALDPSRSILVQAPAGSGKTTLLTERFLTLLGEVDEPGQVVAITFTNAAAAEMRHRILDELRSPDPSWLATRVLARAEVRAWKLLDLPAQLRISTIDAFCRELALQQPLLSELGGGLEIAEQPDDLYRKAARQTLGQIGKREDSAVSEAVENLLKWRDNDWRELEDLLVVMLSQRDRWMQDFVLRRNADWDALRARLERPFAEAVLNGLTEVSELLDQVPGALEEALALARFACSQPSGQQHQTLAELIEFPNAPFLTADDVEAAHQALSCLAHLVLTLGSTFRKVVDKNHGFPVDRKAEKARILALIGDLRAVPGLESSLAGVRKLPPARYTEDDWTIVRACFTLLRYAVGQLKVAFAEAARADFVEVAQIAGGVLQGDDGLPTDAAMAVADGVRHLLVDEFQDTSRRQYQLLSRLIAAWNDRTGRTLFAVGDPMQSIYFFRDADTELFARVKERGLEVPGAEPLLLDFVPLSANFRTVPSLVKRLNDVFGLVFAEDDGSGVDFSPAEPARDSQEVPGKNFRLHLGFVPPAASKKAFDPGAETAKHPETKEDQEAAQVVEIVDLIRNHQTAMEAARAAGGKYRIAVLARARRSLAPIAETLRDAAIPFRAVDLETLASRPEVLDALALAHALLNPYDRVAWLGVLRAPWCGLSLADLHAVASGDDPALLARPVAELLVERVHLLSEAGKIAARRVMTALAMVPDLRAGQPTASLGTWLEQIWTMLGGEDCYDATARANLDLLWRCLDSLPGGAQDLLGPALDAALRKLTALPDLEASSDCGVQLMTIHKSKGLEFEVVIVPDLQARTSARHNKMLSWMERGLKPDGDSEFDEQAAGEITEFLVAPIQTKGEDSGRSRAWVEQVYKNRESQEMRRILYVAATRAREELHLFARPAYKVEANGEFSLAEPSAGLLSTAWPGLEDEIHAQFDTWKTNRAEVAADAAMDEFEQAEIASLVASGESNLLVMASEPGRKPAFVRRLPGDYKPSHTQAFEASAVATPIAGLGDFELYARHEGGLVSRALGTAVHALLEELARLRANHDWAASRTALRRVEPRIAAQVRAAGIGVAHAAQLAADALRIALDASADPHGQWILSPHADAASEVRWASVAEGALATVRVDRVFRAGLAPNSEGDAAWWIVDYKTAQATNAAGVAALRPLFASQLDAYARVLRNLHGADAVIRAGLYYPRMLMLDWWEL
jgi:ATP-dependent helicase/nuclease subunit A